MVWYAPPLPPISRPLEVEGPWGCSGAAGPLGGEYAHTIGGNRVRAANESPPSIARGHCSCDLQSPWSAGFKGGWPERGPTRLTLFESGTERSSGIIFPCPPHVGRAGHRPAGSPGAGGGGGGVGICLWLTWHGLAEMAVRTVAFDVQSLIKCVPHLRPAPLSRVCNGLVGLRTSSGGVPADAVVPSAARRHAVPGGQWTVDDRPPSTAAWFV